jgi:AcrR family transcriptional regulator
LAPIDAGSAETRERILTSAAVEFASLGYAGTSIGALAEAAGVGKGLVQYHFKAKSDLAVELINASFSRAPFANGADDSLHGIDAIVASIREVAAAFRDDIRVRAAVRLMREYHTIPVELPRPYVGWIARIGNFLGEAESAGEIASGLDHAVEGWQLVAYFTGVQEVSNRLTASADLPERIEAMLERALGALGVVHAERYL